MKRFDPFAPHNRLQFCKKEIWHIHVWKVPLSNALLHNRAYHFRTLHMQIINWYRYLRMIFSSVKTRTLLWMECAELDVNFLRRCSLVDISRLIFMLGLTEKTTKRSATLYFYVFANWVWISQTLVEYLLLHGIIINSIAPYQEIWIIRWLFFVQGRPELHTYISISLPWSNTYSCTDQNMPLKRAYLNP